ncbi:MAG: universal stress protein [Hyphomicrobium sp.]|jgi:nucleotide-binding universal stress UspA family protein
MKKILCAVDDSEHSKKAAHIAGAFASAMGASLTLLAVNERIGGYTRKDAAAMLWAPAALERLLADAAQEAKSAGAKEVATIVTESYDVARTISHTAEAQGFDHIVIGSGGKGAVMRLVLGSVSGDVANRAPCSVTIAR